jgi:hypothetical protein
VTVTPLVAGAAEGVTVTVALLLSYSELTAATVSVPMGRTVTEAPELLTLVNCAAAAPVMENVTARDWPPALDAAERVKHCVCAAPADQLTLLLMLPPTSMLSVTPPVPTAALGVAHTLLLLPA